MSPPHDPDPPPLPSTFPPVLPPPKVHVDPLHNIVLLGVVRVVLARYLKDGGDGGVVVLEDVTYSRGDVLVDQDYADVAATGHLLEGALDLVGGGGVVDYEEVLVLGGTVATAGEEETGHGVLFREEGGEWSGLGCRG